METAVFFTFKGHPRTDYFCQAVVVEGLNF